MSQQEMVRQLETLKAALAASDGLETEARERMVALIDQLEAQASDPAGADGGLIDQLEGRAAEFEASHPALSGTLKDIMVMLANMGV